MSKLVIGHMYREELNLYGDNGNVEVLCARCSLRNIDHEVIEIGPGETSANDVERINLIFMGGGPDSSQKGIYQDFLTKKRSYLADYVYSGKTGLFVCGSYQLLGEYYKAADGSELKGLGIFPAHTIHFGKDKPRCIGNVRAVVGAGIKDDPIFKNTGFLGETLVGFENHGGRTYLKEGATPFARVTYGHGNNSEDGTEGIVVGGCIGTYFHGPVLAKNPHLADYLIAKALNVDRLPLLDDDLSIASFSASKKLR